MENGRGKRDGEWEGKEEGKGKRHPLFVCTVLIIYDK